MQPTASEVRRRARYHVLRSPPAEMAQGLTRTRRSMVLLLQAGVLALLAAGGFSLPRLFAHVSICVFYLVACRTPALPVAERTKMSLLVCTLLSYGAWLLNTGGLLSPLMPLGMGIILPALLVFDTGRPRVFFITGLLALLVGIGVASTLPIGRLVPPLAPVAGAPTLTYLAILAGTILVTVVYVSGFWALVTAAYVNVAVELGHRREQLCSMGEERVRELEGAAASLAHEMKNPLASIKALSTLLARCPTLDQRMAERLAVVSAEADHLASIMDSFISLSHGLGELDLGPVRAHAVALELKSLLDERALQAGVHIEVTGRPDVEIVADAKKLQRALFHLTMNAVQASATGQTVTLDIQAVTPPNALAIAIIDRGRGMCPLSLARLQRPPFSTRAGGSGLGVAVARTLVNQHGGQLRYQSAPSQGTTVTVELPRRPPARPVGVPVSPTGQGEAARAG